MGKEIERKFLVVNDTWRAGVKGVPCRQGYLYAGPKGALRVRIAGEDAFLTVKGKTEGITRDEYEYSIPLADAKALLDTIIEGHLIEKTRYIVRYGGHTWEVDEFSGVNQGLIVAEVELSGETEALDIPDWAGEEVSHDPQYTNASLSRKPFTTW